MPKSKGAIGKNIRRYRQQKEMSQDRLSKLADVAFHTIVKIESGETPNPTIETVRKIAHSLGVSIDDLMK